MFRTALGCELVFEWLSVAQSNLLPTVPANTARSFVTLIIYRGKGSGMTPSITSVRSLIMCEYMSLEMDHLGQARGQLRKVNLQFTTRREVL